MNTFIFLTFSCYHVFGIRAMSHGTVFVIAGGWCSRYSLLGCGFENTRENVGDTVGE